MRYRYVVARSTSVIRRCSSKVHSKRYAPMVWYGRSIANDVDTGLAAVEYEDRSWQSSTTTNIDPTSRVTRRQYT